MRTFAMTWLFVAVSAGLSAQQPEHRAVSRAFEVKAKGTTHYVTVNTTFKFVRLIRDQGVSYDTDLLQTRQLNEVDFAADGVRGSLEVRAWQMHGNREGKELWSFKSEGNSGEALPDFGLYQATSWPCCSAMTVHEYFSLRNGLHLYTANGQPTNQSPDSGLLRIFGHDYRAERFVAFGASYEKGHEQPILQYGDSTVVKQRLELEGHEYGDSFDVPELTLVDGKNKPVEALDGELTFFIVLHFDEDQEPAAELRIPVVDDVIRPELAVLPKGYSLRSLKP